jgi:NAD(P)-dependent dehydrogenase (short-subunit alcohol dehydrogenase family)
MKLLENKVAIVTGASSGIGRSAARLFSRHGASLVVTGRRQAELDELVGEILAGGGLAVAVAGDVTNEDDVRAITNRAVEQFGRLDIALNNAGAVGVMAETTDLSLNDWNEGITTNLTSAFLCAKHQIRAMLSNGGGSVVFTSSFVGNSVGMPGMGAYAAAKAGIVGLTKVLAAEFGPRGIRVNALLPGGTDTPGATMDTPEALSFVEGLHALKRIAWPDEIAQSALYLASDMASFTTGSALYADGGVSITRT